jgi:hypothetical protein
MIAFASPGATAETFALQNRTGYGYDGVAQCDPMRRLSTSLDQFV